MSSMLIANSSVLSLNHPAPPPPRSTLCPYTTLFRSENHHRQSRFIGARQERGRPELPHRDRSEEHTSEFQSRGQLVCRLLLEKKKQYLGSQREPQELPDKHQPGISEDVLVPATSQPS